MIKEALIFIIAIILLLSLYIITAFYFTLAAITVGIAFIIDKLNKNVIINE